LRTSSETVLSKLPRSKHIDSSIGLLQRSPEEDIEDGFETEKDPFHPFDDEDERTHVKANLAFESHKLRLFKGAPAGSYGYSFLMIASSPLSYSRVRFLSLCALALCPFHKEEKRIRSLRARDGPQRKGDLCTDPETITNGCPFKGQ